MEEFVEDYKAYVSSRKNKNVPYNKAKLDEAFVNVKKWKEIQSRVIKIVEFLMVGKIQPEVFVRSLKYLNKSYYDDTVEERSLNKICGYAICDKPILNIPKKSYSIDAKNNQIFDITLRKKFCSNFCYSASEHIKAQMDNSPLWSRDMNCCMQFNLLTKNEKCTYGKVISPILPLEDNSEFVSVATFAGILLQEINEDEVKSEFKKKNSKSTQVMGILKEEIEEFESNKLGSSIEDLDQISSLNKAQTNDLMYNAEKHLSKKAASKNTNSVVIFENKGEVQSKKNKKETKTKKCHNILEIVKRSFYEWITLDTYKFIYGEEKLRYDLNSEKLKRYGKTFKKSEEIQEKTTLFEKLCLNEEQDSLALTKPLCPVSNYENLKKEAKDIKVKVHSFYDGTLYDVTEQNNLGSHNKTECITSTDVLTLVSDGDSLKNTRRTIYLNSINKSLTVLTQNMGISTEKVVMDINLLVKTFNLKAHNIVFEPAIWNIMSLLLIKLLSIRDPVLNNYLNNQRSRYYIHLIFKYLPEAEKLITELLSDISNINVLLEKCTYINEQQ